VAARLLPFGDAAVLVELGGEATLANARRARAFAAAVEGIRGANPSLDPPVPAAASVLVPFDPRRLSAGAVGALLAPLLAAAPEAPVAATPPRQHSIPVRYGGDDGPDLANVARELGLAPTEVVALHGASTYEVLFLGFAPGFAYLGELPAGLVVPRLATPRPSVPAGSVAIAGTMTAVYPARSAGGWRILGRTDARLFDPSATPPALLRPGDLVRFEPA
jgi:KipI family sensor histidine kinase inhibitor